MQVIIEKNPESRISPDQKKFKFGPGFAYHESSQPFLKLKALLKNLETEPELYINKKIKTVYHIPSLINKLRIIEKTNGGIANLHSGAVVNSKNEGIIFSAWQDVGKTTLSLLLSKKSYAILGDDNIDLNRNGTLTRVQTKTGVYPHKDNLQLLQLPFLERLTGWFKFHFLKFTFMSRFINQNLWVNYKYFPRVTQTAVLTRIYILERGHSKTEEIPEEVAVNKLLTTSLAQILPSGFPRQFILTYCFANNLHPTLMQDKYKEIIKAALTGKRIYKISGETHLEIYRQFIENEDKLAQ